jgi:hypothetical protein
MRFFKLFEESTFEGSRAAARKMREIARRQTKPNQKFLLCHSVRALARSSNSEMLSWPNSPLLVMLYFVDANDNPPLQGGETRFTLLHQLANLADHSDYSTHENQLILTRQLIAHGANVNAASIQDATPLHIACCGGTVTNLDFIQLLLEKVLDPNSQDHLGTTPLMWTTPTAPGAAKFLLNWPTTDANITTQSGASFLARVRESVVYCSDNARPGNPARVQHQFLLRQWREIEEMLVERGAHDTGIVTLE